MPERICPPGLSRRRGGAAWPSAEARPPASRRRHQLAGAAHFPVVGVDGRQASTWSSSSATNRARCSSGSHSSSDGGINRI
jgi:hypothetical protein